jgi:hypothetical protein
VYLKYSKRNATQQKQNGTTCTKKTKYRSAAHFGNKITREWSREAPAATAQAQQQQQRAGKHCRAQQQHSTAQQTRAAQQITAQGRTVASKQNSGTVSSIETARKQK